MPYFYLTPNSNETIGDVSKHWNSLNGAESGAAVFDENNIELVDWLVDSSFPIYDNLVVSEITTGGDAFWVDELAVVADAMQCTGSTWRSITVTPPNDAESSYIELYGYTTNANRIVEVRVNGGVSKTLLISNNLTNVIRFGPFLHSDGALLIEAKQANDSDGTAYLQAIRFVDDISLPVLTPTAPLVSGQPFTVNYTDFPGVPVSPATLRDGKGNTKDVAVVVTDNGDGSGSFTGTVPELPTSGTADLVLFGKIFLDIDQ